MTTGGLGTFFRDGICDVRVWAPHANTVALRIHGDDRVVPLNAGERGYFSATVKDITPGARYTYVLDGDREYPDPASRSQPEGVHSASAVVADSFAWSDADWRAHALRDLIIQELHVGTFTDAGTFDAVIPHLTRLLDVGINAIELLPVAQFPGTRNWGYDGVYPFAVQNSYGGPDGLKRLVDAAHAAGMAVILDVVYNHFGPEGNYLPAFGPYFTDKYRTPWGPSLNFDDAWSDEVRAFFVQSAIRWLEEFHCDGLRFDAVHAIVDASARPFLAELTDTLRDRAASLGRTIYLIAESDLSDPRMVTPTDRGGLGFDTQWLDDFHHSLHSIVTGETQGYYVDYGELRHLADAFERAYVYAGHYSHHRRRRHGAPVSRAAAGQFIICAQNHDQIGNRLAGDRLSTLVPFDKLKLIAAATLLAPYVPMLFMGEEYGEESPFPYFVSHGEPALIDAVRAGRKQEFASFGWSQEPPDPQSEATFRSAVIDPTRAARSGHRGILDLHRDLIALRKATPMIQNYDDLATDVDDENRVLRIRRRNRSAELLLILNFSERTHTAALDGDWNLLLATDDPRYRADLAQPLETAFRQRARGAGAVIADAFNVAPRSAALLLQEHL